MWTLKQFETVYDRYQSSSLRVKEFCWNERILESKFYYWQRRLREHNQRKEQPPGFVPIVFTDANQQLTAKKVVQQQSNPEHMHPSGGNVFEIVYPNGVKLRVPIEADLTQLRSLILLTQ
jgi:hypothetical protein